MVSTWMYWQSLAAGSACHQGNGLYLCACAGETTGLGYNFPGSAVKTQVIGCWWKGWDKHHLWRCRFPHSKWSEWSASTIVERLWWWVVWNHGKASRCLMTQTMCSDPICTVAEDWCCSEHYLWLWAAFWWWFLVGGIDCSVLLSCGLFWGW